MRQELSIWGTGLSIGAAAGVLLWILVDTILVDRGALGLAGCAAVALGIGYLWSTNEKKRRAWRIAEAAALSTAVVR